MHNNSLLRMNFTFLIISIMFISSTYSQSKTRLIRKDNKPILIKEKKLDGTNRNFIIRGEGFHRFEQVSIFIKEISKYQEENTLLANWIEIADKNGKNSFDWFSPFEGNFEIIAIGNKSKLEARTTISNLVPTPVVVSGNPDCGDINSSTNPAFSHITSDWGFKLDNGNTETNANHPYVTAGGSGGNELTGGAPSDPGNSVTVTRTSSEVTQWTSTRPITAVIIKRGNSAVVYPYDPESLGPDGPLPTGVQQGISHVEFCFQPPPTTAKIIIIKHTTPPTGLVTFNFTASPGLSPANFPLTDDQINTDPMQMFTVTDFNVKTITETNPNAGGYTLQSIVCNVDIGTGGTPQPVPVGNSVDIDIKAGDQVTCTFNNDLLTAAPVSISGRVLTRKDRGIRGARVTIIDHLGNNQTVRTNNFGYYRFNNVDAGESYTVHIQHRRFAFDTHLINVSENITNLVFRPRN